MDTDRGAGGTGLVQGQLLGSGSGNGGAPDVSPLPHSLLGTLGTDCGIQLEGLQEVCCKMLAQQPVQGWLPCLDGHLRPQ